MHNALKNIARELDKGHIQYSMVDECIHVELPKHFDTLIIEIWNAQGEDSISLLSGSFHTHGHIEASEYELDSREEGIRHLIECIFNGTFKMVRRPNKDGQLENTIWDTFSLSLIREDDVFEIVEV